jgi:hypothetical protein
MRIYIASTPYHLLLVGALQSEDRDKEAYVFYDDEVGFLARLAGPIDFFPNVALKIVRPFERHSSRLGKVIKSRSNARRIRQRIRQVTNPELYLFSATRRDVLRLMHLINGSVPAHYVEDGLDAYLPHSSQTKYVRGNVIQHYGNRIANGFPAPRVFDMTTATKFDSFHLLFPKFRRSSIPFDKTEKIHEGAFKQAVERLRESIDEFLPDRTPTHIVFPSHSSQISNVSEYLSSVKQWIADAKSTYPDNVCAIKLHPRESNNEIITGLSALEVVLYPSWIPAELIVHRLSPTCEILTGLSTFILSSSIIMPQRRLVLDETVSPEYARLFRIWDEPRRDSDGH